MRKRLVKQLALLCKKDFKSYPIVAIVPLFFVSLFLLPSISCAQEPSRREINLDQFIQELFSQPSEDVNYEDLYESLYQLYANPLDLNTATREELAATYILSELQLNSFFQYRQQNGLLLSVYELQAIPDFDLPTIYRLLPFVEVRQTRASSQSFWHRLTHEPNNYLLLRYSQILERKKGFTPADTSSNGKVNQRYAGSPSQLYARYRVSHAHDFSFGFTLEKDAGEQLVWQSGTRRYISDFISFHGILENRGRWRRIAVGDYQLQAGQGLLLGAGFVIGKGSETITTARRNQLGIRPYTSAMEFGFFRGLAATYQLGRLDITSFYSNTRRDANLLSVNDSTSDTYTGDFIQSIQATGYHRTLREISAKGNIGEQVAGSSLHYRNRNNSLQMGGTALFSRFSVPLQSSPSDYNQFEFNGQENWNVSLHYSYLWQNFNFFGEAARSKSGGIGVVSGLVASLTPKVDFSMLYRHYDRHFHSFYGNAFSENTRNINERGLYCGLKIVPVRKLTFSAYYDQFRFPWLKFRVDAPSKGFEYLMRISYQHSKSVLFYAQWREEKKERNQSGNPLPINLLTATHRRNWLLNADYRIFKWLNLQTRAQGSSFRQNTGITYGYACVQDATVDLGKLKVSTRLALFNTDNYDNRQYVYEKDVLYAFSLPAYYEQGTRHYLLLQYSLGRHVDLWAHYARTSLRNKNTIGSGLDEINAPHKSEVKVQMRVKF